MNGLPTAEIHARSLLACGVTTYSSALLTFMPEIATEFHRAFSIHDEFAMDDLMYRAIMPFAEIRNRAPGYAISLLKAGARLRGIPVGSARSPLCDPGARDEADLRALLVALGLDHGLVLS
jgi:5-dehydro-4-deoxyglucarate dehydratase